MSLITMGYGHLTIITMGLGNSIRIISVEERHAQYGKVEFKNTTPQIEVSEEVVDLSFDEKEIKVRISDKPKVVSFDE